MNAWPILGHFLPIFYGFSSKLPEIAKFLLKIVTSCHFEYFSADFHEYTLNMTLYHETEAINGYF